MSDNFSLIVKNGSCYIDGKLTQTDIGLSGDKIKKIGFYELVSLSYLDSFIEAFSKNIKNFTLYRKYKIYDIKFFWSKDYELTVNSWSC